MNSEEETPLKQIRTFQGDVAEVLQKERGSLVSIQRAEHLKKSSLQNTSSPDNAQTKVESFYLIVGSFVLFALGVAVAWYAYSEFIKKTFTPITIAPINRFVAVDAEVNLNLAVSSRETLIGLLPGAILDAAPGELRHLVLEKEKAGESAYLFPISEFLEILEIQAPNSLVRSFDPPFMLGTLGKSVFLIIKLVSFENAFAGMLAWEKNLSQDIGPLFATSELSRNLTAESTFTDITDKNKDVRVLASGNQTVLLYSFFNNNMLIITDNIETLRALIDRLTREKLSR